MSVVPPLAHTSGDTRTPGASSAVLRDGRRVRVRVFDAAKDADALEEILAGMSADSRWTRYHTGLTSISPYMRRRLVDDVDGRLHAARLLTSADGRRALGVGRLVRPSRTASTGEVALEVVDEVRGLGAGRILLTAIAECAATIGVHTLLGDVVAENAAALRLVRRFGAEASCHSRGVVSVRLVTAHVLGLSA